MPSESRKTKGRHDAIEVAWYTKELGRNLQRQLLKQRLDGLAEMRNAEASHREETADAALAPPQEDRAG